MTTQVGYVFNYGNQIGSNFSSTPQREIWCWSKFYVTKY